MECVESNPCLRETFNVFNGGNFMFFTTYIENLDELCNLEIRPSEPHPGCCSSDIHLRLLGCRNEIPS